MSQMAEKTRQADSGEILPDGKLIGWGDVDLWSGEWNFYSGRLHVNDPKEPAGVADSAYSFFADPNAGRFSHPGTVRPQGQQSWQKLDVSQGTRGWILHAEIKVSSSE
jgi:hypothetical protein